MTTYILLSTWYAVWQINIIVVLVLRNLLFGIIYFYAGLTQSYFFVFIYFKYIYTGW
jgi:hypothetical protein